MLQRNVLGLGSELRRARPHPRLAVRLEVREDGDGCLAGGGGRGGVAVSHAPVTPGRRGGVAISNAGSTPLARRETFSRIPTRGDVNQVRYKGRKIVIE